MLFAQTLYIDAKSISLYLSTPDSFEALYLISLLLFNITITWTLLGCLVILYLIGILIQKSMNFQDLVIMMVWQRMCQTYGDSDSNF